MSKDRNRVDVKTKKQSVDNGVQSDTVGGRFG